MKRLELCMGRSKTRCLTCIPNTFFDMAKILILKFSVLKNFLGLCESFYYFVDYFKDPTFTMCSKNCFTQVSFRMQFKSPRISVIQPKPVLFNFFFTLRFTLHVPMSPITAMGNLLNATFSAQRSARYQFGHCFQYPYNRLTRLM